MLCVGRAASSLDTTGAASIPGPGLMNDGVWQSQEIVKHGKLVVKFELRVSKLVCTSVCVCVCVHKNKYRLSLMPPLLPSHPSYSPRLLSVFPLLITDSLWALCQALRFLNLYGSKVIIKQVDTGHKLNPMDRLS